MPATAYGNRKVLVASELDRTDHIAGVLTSNNEGRIAVDQSIPDPASTAVAIVARRQYFTPKLGFEMLKRSEFHVLLHHSPFFSVQCNKPKSATSSHPRRKKL